MPFLNTHALLLPAGDLAPSIEDVRTALVGLVQEVLVKHDAAFTTTRVVSHYEDAVTNARSRADRLTIMGDPARYAEVVWAGIAGRRDGRLLHRFNVFVHYGQGGATRAVHAAAFRNLAYSQAVASGTPGLLYALERSPLDASVGGTPVELMGNGEDGWVIPENVAADFVPVDPKNDEYRWELSFTVALG